jgi:hypothetical protein
METIQATVRDFAGNREAIEAAIRSCERSQTTGSRSFFVKKLEQHFQEKGIKIPDQIFDLFDTPFTEFTPQYAKVYEERIKGQALFHIFSDMLVEIFEMLNADRTGWEAAANYLYDTPMKICALHALARIQQLEEIPEEIDYLDLMEEFSGKAKQIRVTPREQKRNIRPYRENGKGRWKK